MAENVIFWDQRTNVTIDSEALTAELARLGMHLKLSRDTVHEHVPVVGFFTRKIPDHGDDPCVAEIYRSAGGGRTILLDTERFAAHERVEGTARLLRRILPRPAAVLATMTPDQFESFQGGKATSPTGPEGE